MNGTIMDGAMNRLIDRRKILFAAGTAIAAVAAGAAAAQTTPAHGTIRYEGGAKIPEGIIEIQLKDPAVQGDARRPAVAVRIRSKGGSTSADFPLPLSVNPSAVTHQQIVARLLREDGWLLARGSAIFKTGSPIDITLYTALY